MGQTWHLILFSNRFLWILWLAVSIWYYQGAELTKPPEEQKYRKFCKVRSSKVLRYSPSNVNISRPLGNSLRFCLKPCPNVKCSNVSGNLSKLWLNSQPNLKDWRRGKFTFCKRWLNEAPKVKLWRCGQLTPSKVWLKLDPKVKLWRCCGQTIWSKVMLNFQPNVKRWRLLKQTRSNGWLNSSPKTKFKRPSGNTIPSKLRLKESPSVKLCRFFGKLKFKSWSKAPPNVSVCKPFGKKWPSKVSTSNVRFNNPSGKEIKSKSIPSPKVKVIKVFGRIIFGQELIFNASSCEGQLICWNRSHCKDSKASGKIIPSKSSNPPKFKCRRPWGRRTWSTVWWNPSPKDKYFKVLGHFIAGWLKEDPKDIVSRSGRFKPKLWLNAQPKWRCLRLLGRLTPLNGWLNPSPKVKVLREGKVIRSKLWLNIRPKVKVSSLGKFNFSKLWLK